MNKKFKIEVEMEERWINDFCSFLKKLEHYGNIGTSEYIGFYADGERDFRPKFSINTEFKEIDGIKNKFDITPSIIFDAG